MADIWTVISSISTALVLLGTVCVAYQLHKQRRWHIQHSALEMASRFTQPEVFRHWLKVRNQLMPEGKPFDDLTEDEQDSVVSLLSFFETIGAMHTHGILDAPIIVDCFGSVIRELYKYTAAFLPRYRERRGNPHIYSEFEKLALMLKS